MGLIIDLDQTLVDSSIAEKARNSRDWKGAVNLIPSFVLYPGIKNVLEYIYTYKIPFVIVTSSVSYYCNNTLSYWNIRPIESVCYHDTKRHKPNPEPILKAIAMLSSEQSSIYSFGDRDIDILASNAANVISVACLWGATDIDALISSNPNYILNQPIEILNLLSGKC